jgi:signal transduction histidine kinase
MKLRQKILARISLLTFLIIVAMSVTYYYIFTKNVRVRSQQRVELAVALIVDDLRTRVDTTLPQIEKFVASSLLSPLYMLEVLQQEDQTNNREPTVWQLTKQLTYLSGMALDLKQFSALSDAQQLLVYDAQGRLIAASWTNKEHITGVYLSDVQGGIFAPIREADLWYAMLQNLAEIPRQPLPAHISPHYQGAIPATTVVTTDTLDKLVALRFTTPVREKGALKGICVFHLPIRQQDVERYARLSGTQVNVFAGSALSVGTLPKWDFLPSELAPTVQRVDWQKLTELPSLNFSDRKLQGLSYYQGIFSLDNAAGRVGAIAVHYPLVLEAQEKKSFFLVVAGITLVFSFLAVAEAFGLSAAIVRPITRLMTVMKAVETGQLDVKAAVETTDEIGQLAETFNLMTAQLKQSFEQIEREHRQIERQNKELQRLDKLKDEFLSNTSHELRTPLNGIAGLAEAILNGVDGVINEPQTRHIRMIVQSSKRLTSLVNELLDFSKIKTTKFELHVNPFPLREVVDVVCAFAQPLLAEKPIELRSEIPPDLPEIYGDLDRVEQILTNLLGNAIKFTQHGTIAIAAQREGEMIRISVQDTGIGIPAEAFERIFHPFEQVDGSMTREFGGTGLGLAITKELVDLHGGKIWVESEAGQGSTFHVTLPCTEKEQTFEKTKLVEVSPEQPQIPEEFAPKEAAPEEPMTPTPLPESTSGEGYTILIIDDDPTNLEMLKTLLEHAGFMVLQASNGQEAFDIINGLQIDLILCDVMMPLVDGYTFAMRVREHERLRNIPLIFVSAKDQTLDKLKGYRMGGIDYLTKPVAYEELLLKVQAILQLHRRIQERYIPVGVVKTQDHVYEINHEKEPQYQTIRAGNGEKILVVDDELINIEVFKAHLSRYNYQVLTASNGYEALDLIDQEHPDIVLLDLMMPKMSGFRVCQIIRTEKRLLHLPIIMLTAKSNIYDKVYGLNLGANDYIIKPFHPDELLTRIYVLLSIAALQKELIWNNQALESEVLERKQAEEALQRLNEELEHRVSVRTADLQQSLETLKRTQMQLMQSEKMAALGGVVAGIAHELNTPVGIGVTASSYLREQTVKIHQLYTAGLMKRSHLEEYLISAEKSSEMLLHNLQRIAQHIQNFKQASVTEHAYLGRRSFHVKAYLEDALRSLHDELSQTKHTLTVTGDEAIIIDSYPGALSQIVTSLVMNSIAHAYQEGEQGHLHFHLCQELDRCLIEYTDDGRGISAENLGKIFDPFFTTARGVGGSGLGLHIVYNLVTHHMKGTIHCESQVGGGTTFRLNLPRSIS